MKDHDDFKSLLFSARTNLQLLSMMCGDYISCYLWLMMDYDDVFPMMAQFINKIVIITTKYYLGIDAYLNNFNGRITNKIIGQVTDIKRISIENNKYYI